MPQLRPRTYRSYLVYSVVAVVLLVSSCVVVYGLQHRQNQADLNALLQELDYTSAAELRRGQGCWNGVVYVDGDCAIYAFYTTDLTLDEFSPLVAQVGSGRLWRGSRDRNDLLFLNNYRRPALTINGTLIQSALQASPVTLPDTYDWHGTYNGHRLVVAFYEVARSPHEIAWNGTRIRDNVVQVQLYTNK